MQEVAKPYRSCLVDQPDSLWRLQAFYLCVLWSQLQEASSSAMPT
jgi:hypothetical protein